MLDVVNLRVTSLDIDFNEVSWAIQNVPDALGYTFQVFKSESPEGPFEDISGEFEDRYLFIDNKLIAGNRWRQYYYKLKVRNKANDDTVEYGPTSKTPEPDLIAAELRRGFQLRMEEIDGRRMWILPARTFGQRCSCWSPILKKRTRSGCITCFDTGFVRGYLSPIETWGQLDPSAKSEQRMTVGATQQSNTTGRFPFYPMLKPDDLIIEAENRRWRVVTLTQTEKGRAPIHQEVQLQEVEPKDIEFAIPLKLDTALKDLWISPRRNFTMPTNLENAANDKCEAIFKLYTMGRRP